MFWQGKQKVSPGYSPLMTTRPRRRFVGWLNKLKKFKLYHCPPLLVHLSHPATCYPEAAPRELQIFSILFLRRRGSQCAAFACWGGQPKDRFR